MPGPWSTILRDELRDRANEVLQHICDALAVPDAEWYPDSLAESVAYRDVLRGSLDHGRAGLALFWCALASADPRSDQSAHRYLALAFESFEALLGNASLFEGFTGVAYVAELLRERFPDWFDASDDDDVNGDVDRILVEYLEKTTSESPSDLTMGIAGIGLYFTRRRARHIGRRGLEMVIHRLAERAIRDSAGIYWPADAATHRRQPHYAVNVGVAHGVPGIIGFLSRAVLARGSAGLEAGLLDGAMTWLLSLRRSQPPLFPDLWGPTPSFAARLAWCYSDLSIAIVLLHCGATCAVPQWTLAGLDAARAAAATEVSDVELAGNASLCHGTAGVAHMFNRAYQFTGDRLFQLAAEKWVVATLDRWSPGIGVGGFKSWLSVDEGRNAWNHNPGLLVGAAGIGLALSSSLSSEPPVWDEPFLLDLPNR